MHRCYCLRFLGLFTALGLLLPAAAARGEVRLHTLFSDHMVLQRNEPVPVWGWAEPGEEVTVSIEGNSATTTAGEDGKWKVELPDMEAGGPYTLTVSGTNTIEVQDVLVGEVWVCIGQSNMQFTFGHSALYGQDAAGAEDSELRLGRLGGGVFCEPQEDAGFNWSVSSAGNAANYPAVAYYFGRELRDELGVPVGLIQQSMGATEIECWTPASGSEIVPSQEKFVRMVEQCGGDWRALRQASVDAWMAEYQAAVADAIANERNLPEPPPLPAPVDNRMVQRGWMPLSLYNGMIAPMIPYAMRGVIYYQGEANNGEGMEYYDKMRALIGGWRQAWGQGDFPFYYVEIAPWAGYPEGAVEGIWEAQLAALAIPNTGMAVIHDQVPNLNDIHPNTKKDVGHRLALWALAQTYGQDIVYSGPLYKSATIEGNEIRVAFDHTGSGLTTSNGEAPDYFQIGTPEGFVEATARIEGDTVVVSSEEIENPTYVRFAWKNIAQPNLRNEEGLPAAPFRTDCPPVQFSTGSQFAERKFVELTTDPIPGEIHYTLDGSLPTEDSPLYTLPIELDDTTTVSARMFAADGRSSLVTSATYTKVDPVMLGDKVLAPGVEYDFYIGRWVWLPNFEALTADYSGVIDTLSPVTEYESFLCAHRYEGYLQIPTTGDYTFRVTERDQPIINSLAEAELYLDGEMVLNKDGVRVSPNPDEPLSLVTGRTVRVRLEGDERSLELAEVQVFDAQTGEQLQMGGTATQSSEGYGCPASRASDGNTNNAFFGNSVSLTEAETDPWWQVDLGAEHAIGQIKVFNRGDCCGERLANAYVEVLDDAGEVVWSKQLGETTNGSTHEFTAGDSIHLEAGLHPIAFTYHEGGSPPMFKLLIAGPEMEEQEIPAEMLLHVEQ